MNSDVDWESYALGLIAGIGLVLWLIRFELWLERRPRPAPADPFENLRWEVHAAARQVIEDATR